MPRYIDADALTLKVDDWRVDLEETYGKNDEYVQCLESVLDMIEDTPTADVVKGVRCLLCEHFDPTSPSGTAEPTFYFCKRRKIYVDPYDCCAFGDRREEKTDEVN